MLHSKEDLNKSFKKLGSINEKQQKTIRYFESTTIVLVIAYLLNQTLLFLSVSLHNPASSVCCQTGWIPFYLSLLIAVIFTIAFTRFVTKWERTQYHYDMNFLERELIYHRIVLLQDSQSCSSEQSSMYEQEHPKVIQCDMVKVYQRKACIWLFSLALVAYTVLILKACRSIQCHT